MSRRKTEVFGVKRAMNSAPKRIQRKRLGEILVELERARAPDDPLDRAVDPTDSGGEDNKDCGFQMLAMQPSREDRHDEREPILTWRLHCLANDRMCVKEIIDGMTVNKVSDARIECHPDSN